MVLYEKNNHIIGMLALVKPLMDFLYLAQAYIQYYQTIIKNINTMQGLPQKKTTKLQGLSQTKFSNPYILWCKPLIFSFRVLLLRSIWEQRNRD